MTPTEHTSNPAIGHQRCKRRRGNPEPGTEDPVPYGLRAAIVDVDPLEWDRSDRAVPSNFDQETVR